MHPGGPCDCCGEGIVRLEIYDTKMTWRDVVRKIAMSQLVCDHCESEYAAAPQMRLNRAAVIEMRRQIDEELGIEETEATKAERHGAGSGRRVGTDSEVGVQAAGTGRQVEGSSGTAQA